MTQILLNEAALRQFLESETGPVGLDTRRRAENVTALAGQNAAGDIIGIDTGDLQTGIRFEVIQTAEGVRAEIGTDARHRGFAYPTFHDRNGRPWLTSALRDAFDI